MKKQQAISSPEKKECEHVFEYWIWINIEKCMKCGFVKEKKNESRFIKDARGVIRDEAWLRKKLEMTSTDKKWREDILSRRIMSDGTVIRQKR